MPALTLPLLGFAVGVLFAWAAAEEIAQRQDVLHTQSIWIVTLYSLLVHTPSAVLLIAPYPDWSVAYVVNASSLPTTWVPALVLLNCGAPPLGFLLSGSAAGQGRPVALLRLAGVALALACVNTLTFIDRLVVVATHSEFHNNFGIRGVAGSALGYSLLFLAVLTSAAAAWTHNLLKRVGRRSPALPSRARWLS
jgi:uncharacterized membrane protein YidH (DUF202 family)